MSNHQQLESAAQRAEQAVQRAMRREKLRAQLDEQGAHFTQQRAAVFEYLSQTAHHPTAEDVFLAVKQELPKISLATVYKNLEALVSCGAASKLTYGDAATRYDIRTDHHHHSRCLQCGSITDLEPLGSLEDAGLVQPPQGFKVTNYRLELLGYCPKCQSSEGGI